MPFPCLCIACSGQVKSLNPKLTRANVLPPHDDDKALVVLQSEATHPSPTLRLRSTAACEVYHVALTERIHALIHTREGGRERGTCGNCQKRRRPASPLGQQWPRPRHRSCVRPALWRPGKMYFCLSLVSDEANAPAISRCVASRHWPSK